MYFFFKILFIYSWQRERERQRHRQRENQAPHGESNVVLNPRILGSQPEPKGDAQPLSHPGAPVTDLKKKKKDFIYLFWGEGKESVSP